MNDVAADVETEIAAAIIEDILFLLPSVKRAAVLAIATKNETAAADDRKVHGEFRVISAFDLCKTWEGSPDHLYGNDIAKFKAKIAYTFIRNITNNHSPQDAADLLFRRQRDAPGSGYLAEYIGDLPEPRAGGDC